jgi:hypothetical protein
MNALHLSGLKIAGLAAAAGLLVQPRVAASADLEDRYDRVMATALERATKSLVEATDLWSDHATWENAWVVETEHYSVRTTASWYLANKIANDLEYMLGEFRSLLDTDFAPSEKFQVLIYPSLAQYNAAGQNAAEHSSFYGSYYASGDPGLPVYTYFTPNQASLGMWVTHAALHQFVEQAFRVVPAAWVSEGLATYFALFWGWQWGADTLDVMKQRGRFISLRDLLGARLSGYTNNSDDRLIELGMLFKYLLHHREESRIPAEDGESSEAPFVDFLRRVVRGENGARTAFARWFSDEGQSIEDGLRTFEF